MKDNFIEFACRMIVWKIRYKWHKLMMKYWERKCSSYNRKHFVAWCKMTHHIDMRTVIVAKTNIYAEIRNQQTETES